MNMHKAKRPVLVFGAGIHQGHAADEARALAELLQWPVALTWGAADLLPESNPLRIGTFGTHGTRAANFAVQNANYLLCIGTRLDTKATGSPAKWFAREAHIVMVDIDQAEIAKMAQVGVTVEGICTDAKKYISGLIRSIGAQASIPEWWPASDCADWLDRCQYWKRRYPAVLPEYEREEGVNPYVLVRELSRLAEPGEIIVCDTGCAIAWTCQAWEFKEGQRLLHPWNQTPMGYALPGAIGAHYATGRRVICITGDGAIMMSIGELATIAGNNLPIKIVLLNNKGHAMCRQSQREWMGGTYPSTSIEGGLRFPRFDACAMGFGLNTIKAGRYSKTHGLHMLFDIEGPLFMEFMIPPDADVVPKGKAGDANENQYPYLPADVLAAEMVIGPPR